jgi:hypothetical protein
MAGDQDVVKRLRRIVDSGRHWNEARPCMLEAADEIERQRQVIAEHCLAAFQMGVMAGEREKEIERLRIALSRALDSLDER